MKSLPKRRGAGASGSDKVRSPYCVTSVPFVDTPQPQIQVPKNGAVYFGRTRDPSEAAAATATSEVRALAHGNISHLTSRSPNQHPNLAASGALARQAILSEVPS